MHFHDDHAPKGGPYIYPPGAMPPPGARACNLPFVHPTNAGWCRHDIDALTANHLAMHDSGDFSKPIGFCHGGAKMPCDGSGVVTPYV